jgi:hypothetical protein
VLLKGQSRYRLLSLSIPALFSRFFGFPVAGQSATRSRRSSGMPRGRFPSLENKDAASLTLIAPTHTTDHTIPAYQSDQCLIGTLAARSIYPLLATRQLHTPSCCRTFHPTSISDVDFRLSQQYATQGRKREEGIRTREEGRERGQEAGCCYCR